MIWEWIAEKSTALMAFLIGLGALAAAVMNSRYRYVCLCVALLAIFYGYRQIKKHDTPFERHERDLRRRKL
jgi:hydrogenase/urease accessory protein HupE